MVEQVAKAIENAPRFVALCEDGNARGTYLKAVVDELARAAVEAMREAERPTLRNWCYFGSAGGGFLGTDTGAADQPWHFERLDRPA